MIYLKVSLKMNTTISINESQLLKMVGLLRSSNVPSEKESENHLFTKDADLRLLASSYFAIVAICHQTSPIGEQQLKGYINGTQKVGWDYLKEKFLNKAHAEPEWASPDYWATLAPSKLSKLYEDPQEGKTLNRINERTFLLNDLGNQLKEHGFSSIEDAFNYHRRLIGGDNGFLNFLKTFEAYRDPVMKKSQFFLSIMANECAWKIEDQHNLSSPVDYHEMRGHLRIGTIDINDQRLSMKVQYGLVLTEKEDIELRSKVQQVNDQIGKQTGLGSSKVHYLLWNVFRNCCPRDSSKTHCTSCRDGCKLPSRYKRMPTYKKQCLFSEFCCSANQPDKLVDPPYLGHFY